MGIGSLAPLSAIRVHPGREPLRLKPSCRTEDRAQIAGAKRDVGGRVVSLTHAPSSRVVFITETGNHTLGLPFAGESAPRDHGYTLYGAISDRGTRAPFHAIAMRAWQPPS